MRIRYFALALAWWGSSSAAFAAGTTSAEFLKFGVGARYLGMGSAGTATVDDSAAVYWNPAALGGLKNGHFMMMQAETLDAGRYSFAGIAHPVGKWGGVAAGVQSASVGNLGMTDEYGNPLGDIHPRDNSVSLAWGRRWASAWEAGMGAQWTQSKIVHTASAFSLDFGGAYEWRDVRVGLSFRQALATELQYDQEKSPLPRIIQLGGAYRWKKRWLAALDVNDTRGSDVSLGGGLEYAHPLSRRQTAFVRGGYQTRPNDLPGVQGFTAGLGWRWESLDVDYAFLPMGQIDGSQTHRISLGIRFGGRESEPRYAPPPPPPATVKKPQPSPHTAPPVIPAAPTRQRHVLATCPARHFGEAHHEPGCRVRVLPNLDFDSNMEMPKKGRTENLGAVAEFLKHHRSYELEIEGHADAQGTDVFNQRLSERRAEHIRNILIYRYGVSEQRVRAIGYGERRPVADNRTPTGRQKNRQAGVILMEVGPR